MTRAACSPSCLPAGPSWRWTRTCTTTWPRCTRRYATRRSRRCAGAAAMHRAGCRRGRGRFAGAGAGAAGRRVAGRVRRCRCWGCRCAGCFLSCACLKPLHPLPHPPVPSLLAVCRPLCCPGPKWHGRFLQHQRGVSPAPAKWPALTAASVSLSFGTVLSIFPARAAVPLPAVRPLARPVWPVHPAGKPCAPVQPLTSVSPAVWRPAPLQRSREGAGGAHWQPADQGAHRQPRQGEAGGRDRQGCRAAGRRSALASFALSCSRGLPPPSNTAAPRPAALIPWHGVHVLLRSLA